MARRPIPNVETNPDTLLTRIQVGDQMIIGLDLDQIQKIRDRCNTILGIPDSMRDILEGNPGPYRTPDNVLFFRRLGVNGPEVG